MKFRGYIILTFIPLLFFACCGHSPIGKNQPASVDGVLDLTDWDFKKDGIVSLDCQWEFYWKSLFGPEDFAEQAAGNGGSNRPPVKTGFIKVPSIWNDYTLSNRKLTGDGYCTYRLRVKLKDNNRAMGLMMQTVATSYRAWVNGRALISNGVVASDRKGEVPASFPLAVFFPAGKDLELIVQMANFYDYKGGFWTSAFLGTQEQILLEKQRRSQLDLFLIGALFIMGIYHLVLFSIRKKDRTPLIFGIFCLLIVIRTGFEGEDYFVSLFPGIDWELQYKISITSFGLSVLAFIFFLREIFRIIMVKWADWIIIAVSVLFCLTVILTPDKIYENALALFEAFTIFAGLYALAGLVRYIALRKIEAVIILGGFLVLFITVVNDILYSNFIINTALVAPFGFFTFIFSQAVMLSIRFSRAFNETEVLSQELQVKSGQLEEYSKGLEQKVSERTFQLSAEKNKLEKRNRLIENDLNMARLIQMKTIPAGAPTENIAFYYKPMDKVGGDFLDFIKFSNADLTGIFVSDVSGHGVPAAFITLIIKSVLLQIGPYVSQPEFVLTQLNDGLVQQSAGNFVTAFYGIYNNKTRVLSFSSAGHYLPYLITGNKIEQVKSTVKAMPLGLMNNREQAEINYSYRPERIKLEKGAKLLLYTDGLIEATRSGDAGAKSGQAIRDYEAMALEKDIRDLHDLPAQFFIRELYDRLVSFRGDDDFDDDVCIICMDVE